MHSSCCFQPAVLQLRTFYHQNGKTGTTYWLNADDSCQLMERLNWSRCFQSSSYVRWNDWWQVESSSGKNLFFFRNWQSGSVGTLPLWLWRLRIETVCLRAAVHSLSVKLVGCIILVSKAEAEKRNRLFLSFTAAEINWCKHLVFGLFSSIMSKMLTTIYVHSTSSTEASWENPLLSRFSHYSVMW